MLFLDFSLRCGIMKETTLKRMADMSERERDLSRRLGRLDLNKTEAPLPLYTHWCRTVYASLERWNPKEHAHLFWELHLCLRGEMQIRAGGELHTLTESTFVFLPPGCAHTILRQSEAYAELVWGFGIRDDGKMDATLCRCYGKTAVLAATEEMLRSVKVMLENAERAGFGYFHIIKNELYHIFALLAEAAGAKEQGDYRKPNHLDLAPLKAYLRENLQSDVDAEDVALFLGVSQSELACFLKREHSKTFGEIKRQVKVEAITSLLGETELTMEEIAEATGFADRYSMGKFFKKNAGATPGAYRKGVKK